MQWHILDNRGRPTLPGCVGYLHAGAREPGQLAHLSRSDLVLSTFGRELEFQV
jgi:hypothetical protein